MSDLNNSDNLFTKSNSVGPSDFSSRWRQLKSCARCHRLKIKCVFDDPSYTACARCFAIGVECSPDTDPTAKFAKKHNRRSKSKHQLPESDDPIAQLKLLLQQSQNILASLTGNEISQESLKSMKTEVHSVVSGLANIYGESGIQKYEEFRDFTLLNQEPKIYPQIKFHTNLAKELIFVHNLVSLKEAKDRFAFFHGEIHAYYPLLAFSKKLSDFDYLLENSPLTLMCCIYATTVNFNNIGGKLSKEDRMRNKELNKLLLFYVESFLFYHVYIKSNELDYHFVYAALILALWCPPSNKVGQFKNQMYLLSGYNVSLCINTGNSTNLLKFTPEDSAERDDLRIFLSMYACCASLALSLPRYKLVLWSSSYSNAVSKLMEKDPTSNLPTRGDRYLCYYSKLVKLGQEMIDLLELKGVKPQFDSASETSSPNFIDAKMSIANSKIILDNYERKLYQTLADSGFMFSKEAYAKEKFILSILYYHVLMTVYDNVISGYLYSRKQAFMQPEPTAFLDDASSLLYLQYITKLITVCESMLKTFISLVEHTLNYPTYLYYRVMKALILLVRLQLLINSHCLTNGDLEVNVGYYYDKISNIMTEALQERDSIGWWRMSPIMTKISHWIQVSSTFPTPTSRAQKPGKTDANASFIKLTDMSRGEVENIEAPIEAPKTEEVEGPATKRRRNAMEPPPRVNNQEIKKDYLEGYLKISQDPTEFSTAQTSLQEMFKEIDTEITSYLDPLDSNFNEPSDLPFNYSGGFDSFYDNTTPMFNIFGNRNGL